MNILHHTSMYLPYHASGGEKMLHEYLKGMQQRGHEVSVLAWQPTHDEYDGIRIYNRHEAAECYRTADIVVTHLSAFGEAYNRCRATRKPMVYVVHNRTPNPHVEWHKWVGVVYNSENLRDFYRWRYKQQAVVCRPMGYLWYPDGGRETPPSRVTLTMLNHNINKGGGLFADLARRNRDMKYIAVKGYGDQVEMPEGVEVLDNMPDITAVFARTDLLVMASEKESYGRAAAEALMTGIPVIATRTEGLIECLGDDWPLLMDRRDVESIERCVVWACTHWQMLRNFVIKRGNALRAQVSDDVDAFERYLKFKINENPYII